MEWTDRAIVISSSKHGEGSLIVRLLTENHGLHAGLVRGVKKSSAICQPGNFINVTWKARLEEHLGNFSVELHRPVFAEVFDEPLKLSAVNSSCSLVKATLPEREPNEKIFDIVSEFLAGIGNNQSWIQDYIHLELELLGKLGYGLDLSECAATGEKNFLFYVSPKSGRAVSQAGGLPYKEKLLKLPSFLRPVSDTSYAKLAKDIMEIVDGMKLTRYFLEKYVFNSHNNKLPVARERFVQRLRENTA